MGRIARVAVKLIHYHMENSQPVGSCCITHRAQPGALWQPGGMGWDGVRTEREVQEGEDICTLMVDSCCYTTEVNTTLQSNCPPIKNESKTRTQ